jgi:cell division protein FtsI (penicillin-binding protein 3)
MNQVKGRLTRKEHGSLKVRLILISILFALFAVGLAGRLFYLQVAMHEDLVLRSEKQYQRTVDIRYGRGSIFDRNMNELATNIDVESVYATPHEVLGKKQAARTIASALNLNQKSVYEKLRLDRHFVWLKRKAAPTEVALLRNSSLSGVNFISENKRFYPKRELASGAIGFVGIDNQGLAGIEHQFQSTLKGNTVRTVMEKDARGRPIRFGKGVGDQVWGNRSVVLTLDEVIQFFTEHHLKNQVEKYQAKSGIAVVMNPNTGEIYALANIPQYNPNSYSIYQPQRWRNYAISNAYEPGSIFKPIVAAAVIDSGAALPDDMFFCENGKFGIETRNGEATFGEADNHKFGWLTLQNIIVQSSNIGSIKIAQQLGQRSFYDYIRKFGFGQKSGVELPGEAPGKVRGLSSWGLRSLASISFGQEISVTPLQITAAMGAIANGGVLMTPRIAHAVINNGQVGDKFEPKTVRRVISVQTSRQMVDILKSVVKDGTGKKAAVKGYEVAGKTGTAQKYDPKTGGYSKTAFVSSFVGFVPADAAKVAILVMIDEPKGTHWGGSVAAPVFSSIARETLRYLNVPPSDQPADILERT